MEKSLKHSKTLAILLVSVICVTIPGFVRSGVAEAAQQQGLSIEQDADWSEEVSDQIDKTIEVLDIVKEELKEMKKREDLKAAGAPKITDKGKDEEWADVIRGKLSTSIRIWMRVKEVVREETEKAKGAASAQDDSEWAKDLNKKLDETIEAIKVIKEELKEIEEIDTTK